MRRHTRPALLLCLFLTSQASLHTVAAAATAPVDPERVPYARPATLAKLPDGRVVHVKCMGSGSPTVILTAGLGDWGIAWRKIQPAVAKSTRVCVWDRAGFGFSDGSHQVQLIANTTNDLEAALNGAGVAGPYVMVGHSMGSLESVLFTDRNRNSVVGMMLVDPSVPDQAARLRNAAPGVASVLAAYQSKGIDRMRSCAAGVGSGALTTSSPDPDGCLVYAKGYPAETAAALAKLDTDPSRWSAKISLMENFDASAVSLANPARRYGAMPLIILTAGKLQNIPPDMPPASAQEIRHGYPAFAAEFNRAHDDLAALSTRGSNRLVADSGHYIQYERPDLVIAAINEVLAQSRESASAARR